MEQEIINEGAFFEYYQNGVLKREGTRKGGELEGLFCEYKWS